MTESELEAIGLLADKADNFAHAAKLPLHPIMHVKQLTAGMEDMRNELRAIYIKSSGHNPWRDQ